MRSNAKHRVEKTKQVELLQWAKINVTQEIEWGGRWKEQRATEERVANPR